MAGTVTLVFILLGQELNKSLTLHNYWLLPPGEKCEHVTNSHCCSSASNAMDNDLLSLDCNDDDGKNFTKSKWFLFSSPTKGSFITLEN